MATNSCIMCGKEIPEGRLICSDCFNNPSKIEFVQAKEIKNPEPCEIASYSENRLYFPRVFEFCTSLKYKDKEFIITTYCPWRNHKKYRKIHSEKVESIRRMFVK